MLVLSSSVCSWVQFDSWVLRSWNHYCIMTGTFLRIFYARLRRTGIAINEWHQHALAMSLVLSISDWENAIVTVRCSAQHSHSLYMYRKFYSRLQGGRKFWEMCSSLSSAQCFGVVFPQVIRYCSQVPRKGVATPKCLSMLTPCCRKQLDQA